MSELFYAISCFREGGGACGIYYRAIIDSPLILVLFNLGLIAWILSSSRHDFVYFRIILIHLIIMILLLLLLLKLFSLFLQVPQLVINQEADGIESTFHFIFSSKISLHFHPL